MGKKTKAAKEGHTKRVAPAVKQVAVQKFSFQNSLVVGIPEWFRIAQVTKDEEVYSIG